MARAYSNHEVATRERLIELLSMNLTARQMADSLHVSDRTVYRALRRHGLVPPQAPAFQLSFEQEARIEILLGEGMPMTWISEDVQIPMGVLRHRVAVPPVHAKDWQSTWGSILRQPELLQLHREFAPRDVSESWLQMGRAS